jgi:hypothetical protein
MTPGLDGAVRTDRTGSIAASNPSRLARVATGNG